MRHARIPHDRPGVPERGADRGATSRRVRDGGGGAATRRRTAPSTCGWRCSTGHGESSVVDIDRANSIENRLNKVARVSRRRSSRPRAGRASSTTAAWSRSVSEVDRDQRRVARRRRGRPDRRQARNGLPRRAVSRLDRRQARLGEDARGDAAGPLLRADPRARRVLRAHVLRVPRAGAHSVLPAAEVHDPAGARRSGESAVRREPPAAVRHAPARRSTSSRSRCVGVTDLYHSSTTRNGWIAREPDGSPRRATW